MARIVSSGVPGQPGSSVPRRNWPLKPIRFFPQRNVNRVMIHDPASGLNAPEFKNLLGGIALKTRSVARRFQTPQTPPGPNAGVKVVRQARKRVVRR